MTFHMFLSMQGAYGSAKKSSQDQLDEGKQRLSFYSFVPGNLF